MLAAAVAGLLTGLSLIVAIGAQNAYVLRQGILRSHVGAVVLVCAVSDLVLICAGVSGIGALVAHASWLIQVVRWFGVAFLLWYAAGSLRRALRPSTLAAGDGVTSRSRAVGRAVALTWLNPHVYLDTVLLLGSIANAHPGHWWFALGASVASVAWFTGLGFGARMLAPLLATPSAWRVLDVLVAATMVFVAIRLAL